MHIRYDVEEKVMQIDGVDLYPQNLEENFIGVCNNCNSDVLSLSYHSYEKGMIVAGKCKLCDAVYAILYDKDWNWKEEEEISEFFSIKNNKDLKLLDSIGEKKLEAVFTHAEIDTMYAKVHGEKYVRQYLYRARKKYSDFEDLFGIQITI